jgi:hypothetical protein
MGLLSKVSDGCELLRMALYADDAAVFIKPSKQDLQITSCILGIFAEASGLSTNLDKTQFYLSFHFKKLPSSFLQAHYPLGRPLSAHMVCVCQCTR